MKRLRLNLQSKFQISIALLLGIVLLILALLWQRQRQSQSEMVEVSSQSTHVLLLEQLRSSSDAQVRQLADALTNPLYYFDLDAVGALARRALRVPDVDYVLVYDTQGRILHDGSGDIASYGRLMDDPLAKQIISASEPRSLKFGEVLDASSPIMIGEERLGGVRIGYSLAPMARAETHVLSELRERLHEVNQHSRAWMLGLSLGLALLSLGAALLVQRQLVKPIRMLGMAAKQIEAGDFASRIPETNRTDEVGDLVRAFDRMRAGVARHDRDIRRVAYSDSLTGLANRLAFRESLDRRLRELQGAGRQLALLFTDIDDFKQINDTLGHEAGDEVLLQVAMRIQRAVQSLPDVDALVARFGGDEFVILLQAGAANPEGNVRNQVVRLAERLVLELSESLLLYGRQLQLGASIGAAIFPEDASNASLLMKHGDIAMYQAKMAGKNCYRFYSRSMDLAIERRARMEHDLRGAWERGELSLAYQPIHRASDKTLMGAESLLRWNHPSEGPIPPSIFIEVAEQSGLIEVLGLRALRQACMDAAMWPALPGSEGRPFVSVNVSARQLRSGALLEQVTTALAQSGLTADRLHLELTETAVLDNESGTNELLMKLRQLGVKIWLDDFGTGYSSLSHLRRVPVDGLKIDKSFISGLLCNPEDLSLTSAILSMAGSMGITVVAEGVELPGQFELLRERGCDLIQGFWMGHPLPAEEFSELLN